jgi:hypothetical protein
MHVRCTLCHQSIELVQDDLADDVLCPSCGDGFNLVGGDTGHPIEPRTIGQFELFKSGSMGKFDAVSRAMVFGPLELFGGLIHSSGSTISESPGTAGIGHGLDAIDHSCFGPVRR